MAEQIAKRFAAIYADLAVLKLQYHKFLEFNANYLPYFTIVMPYFLTVRVIDHDPNCRPNWFVVVVKKLTG